MDNNLDGIFPRLGRTALAVTLLVGIASCTGMERPSLIRPASEKIAATPEAVEDSYVRLSRSERDVAEYWKNRSFEEFLGTVYREPRGGKYIVDGDTPITDIKHLREFFERKVQKAGRPKAGLAVMNVGGVDVVWNDTEKESLTYCVSTAFGARHAPVVAAMESASGSWEAVTDVNFAHDSGQDGGCSASNDQVLFDVRPVSGADYLARAFFPKDPRAERNVLIDDSAFDLDPNGKLTLAGILRHELGHVLGFRHEHTRPEAGECFEDDNWRPLTDYDAFSTMHYPQCNGAGDWSLALTARDRSGAACLYGAAPGFTIDSSICTPASTPAPPSCNCAERTVSESGSLAKGETANFGPFSAAPGSKFKAQMTGTGDPDLYVRFRIPPGDAPGQYDCRPYLSGASETCDLTVPTGASNTFVTVRGYDAGTFLLQITHTSN